jgi:hypothetical protein
MIPSRLLLSLVLLTPLTAADWRPLVSKNLDAWEVIGDGQWTLMADGTLLGQRTGDLRKMFVPGGPLTAPKDFKSWVDTQSWLRPSSGILDQDHRQQRRLHPRYVPR